MSGEEPTTGSPGDVTTKSAPTLLPKDPNLGLRIGRFRIKSVIASRSASCRFKFEVQLLARLRHPGIAQIYESGSHDEGSGGVPYFAIEYVPGAARSNPQSVLSGRGVIFDAVDRAVSCSRHSGWT